MLFLEILIALVLAGALLVPFLLRVGKAQTRLKPGTPVGAGDVTPGSRDDPAPDMPDAQADPWSPRAHRP